MVDCLGPGGSHALLLLLTYDFECVLVIQYLVYGSFSIWGRIITQLPLVIWFFTKTIMSRIRQYTELKVEKGHGAMKYFLRDKAFSILKDLLIIGLPVLVVLVNDIYGTTGGYAGARLFGLWFLTMVIDHVRERHLFFQDLGWNVVDIAIAVFAMWSFFGISHFIHYLARFKQWSLDPSSTLFLITQHRQLIFPFSFTAFLLWLRILRFLHIFPTIAVPWKTFTNSFSEISSYMIVIVVILLAFSTLYALNCKYS